LIRSAVQLTISEKLNGSPEMFFVNYPFFDLGDILRRIVDPIVLGFVPGWLSLLLIIMIQVMFLVAYLKRAPIGSPRRIRLG